MCVVSASTIVFSSDRFPTDLHTKGGTYGNMEAPAEGVFMQKGIWRYRALIELLTSFKSEKY
jgi:hypothetical protein